MKTHALLAVAGATLVALVGSGCASPPLLEAPGASAVAVGRTADAVALWEALGRAGLVDTKLLRALGPALDAGAPVVASELPNGAVVVATRVVPGAAALAQGAVPVLGKTAAVTVGGARVLVRVDKDRALAALRVPPSDESTVAALLEVMAETKDPPALALPAAGSIRLRADPPFVPDALGPLEALVTVDGATVSARAAAPKANAALLTALASAPPPFQCALEDGAAAVIAIPPFVVDDDAFAGRLVVAAYPDGDSVAVAVAGVPKDAASAASLLDAVRSGAKGRALHETRSGGKTVVDVPGARALHAEVSPARFFMTVGKVPVTGAALDARCTPSRTVVSLRGAPLARLLLPALLTPGDIVAALTAPDDAAGAPLAVLRGVDRFDLAATAQGSALAFEARLGLRSVQE